MRSSKARTRRGLVVQRCHQRDHKSRLRPLPLQFCNGLRDPFAELCRVSTVVRDSARIDLPCAVLLTVEPANHIAFWLVSPRASAIVLQASRSRSILLRVILLRMQDKLDSPTRIEQPPFFDRTIFDDHVKPQVSLFENLRID